MIFHLLLECPALRRCKLHHFAVADMDSLCPVTVSILSDLIKLHKRVQVDGKRAVGSWPKCVDARLQVTTPNYLPI